MVLVPVLVRDPKGHVIEDLKQEDFQIFDRGRRQSISHFAVQKRIGENVEARAGQGTLAAGNTHDTSVSETQVTPVRAAPERFIVFLFDDLHLLAGDLAHVRNAANRMLADSVKSTDAAAVVSISGEVNSGFTRDRTKLEDAIAKLRLQASYQHVRDCPDVSYYEANLILNMNDTDALSVATAEARNCTGLVGSDIRVARPMVPLPEDIARSAAQRELARVDHLTHTTLLAIRAVARSIGAAHGQRTLILISPGFLIASSAAAQADVSKLMDVAAQANVMISALDARGLYTNALDSGERGLLPSDIDRSGNLSRLKEQNRRDSMTADGAIMDELASGTGGTYFHNSNDIEGGFQRVTMAPECMYLLEFSPKDAQPDGSFHRLSVKVNKKGAKVRARPGYFSEKRADVKN